MLPSRYMVIEEKSCPVKRRPRGRGDEPAVTLLPPDPYFIMERPDLGRSLSPTVYRTTAPKSAKNKEASSFVILGETVRTPVQSRPGSPSGRVSPFRGHGFKSPTTTRPNSRAPSPSDSSGKSLKSQKTARERPRIGRDIGLPPKTPVKSQRQTEETVSSTVSEKTEKDEGKEKAESETSGAKAETEEEKPESVVESKETEANDIKTTEENKSDEKPEKVKTVKAKPKQLTPAPERKPPISPTPKPKPKPEKNQQTIIRKPIKPPVPPKKFGLKTSLKDEENAKPPKGVEKKKKKEGMKGKNNASEDAQQKTRKDEESGELGEKKEFERAEPAEKEDSRKEGAVEIPKEEPKTGGKEENKVVDKVENKVVDKVENKMLDKMENKVVDKVKDKMEEKMVDKVKDKTEDKAEVADKPQKLIPCFQPDKCQIAPPTMASPSPIITPTISTPSLTSDLASSSAKNSQSIATAPTTVTPSSLGSVSSTVVLTGNLTRKQTKEPGVALRDSDLSVVPQKPLEMETIEGRGRESLSGEMTSTKVIKAEPETEVLSPNEVRGPPARAVGPNVAWDEGRLANGDVPKKAESGSKFRRGISAVWKFLNYVFFCRCLTSSKCCRSSCREGTAKASLMSRLRCCNPFRNPFECCKCKGKWCEGRGCCCGKREGNPGKQKPRKCCAKSSCCGKGCCDGVKNLFRCSRDKVNNVCRSLFCLNTLCCQRFLRRFRCCHKFKCCQRNGFCSCCNPNVKKEGRKLNKKGSRTSNNSRDKDNLDVVLVEHTSLMKAAIPVLPSCLAIFCLVLNLFVPGFGTFVSGVLCLCFGKARFSVRDSPKSRMGSFVLNTIIGVAQLFTVVFCLVGWGWSIWWGVMMYKLSRRQKRLKLAEKSQKEAEGSNVNHNHVDVEQG